MFYISNFPESKTKVLLLKLCVKLLTKSKTTQCYQSTRRLDLELYTQACFRVGMNAVSELVGT